MVITPQYTTPDVLAHINANLTYIQIFGGLGNLLAYVQMIYGARVGFRDRSHAIPLIANTMFFAHDSWYVLNYHYWFATVHHFFFEMNVFAMAIFVCVELVVAWQIINYSGKEMGLGETKAQALRSYVMIQAGMYVLFLWFKSMMGDPLYLEMFAVSVVFSNVFNIPMLMRRGSRKGQSLVIAWALAIQAGPLYFFVVNPLISPYFATPIWYAVGFANSLVGFAYLWMLYRAAPYQREATAGLHA